MNIYWFNWNCYFYYDALHPVFEK